MLGVALPDAIRDEVLPALAPHLHVADTDVDRLSDVLAATTRQGSSG